MAMFKINTDQNTSFLYKSLLNDPKPRGTDIFFLAWTTTPWTLPGNVALAVGKDIEYSAIEKDGQILILANDLVNKVAGENLTKIKTVNL